MKLDNIKRNQIKIWKFIVICDSFFLNETSSNQDRVLVKQNANTFSYVVYF